MSDDSIAGIVNSIMPKSEIDSYRERILRRIYKEMEHEKVDCAKTGRKQLFDYATYTEVRRDLLEKCTSYYQLMACERTLLGDKMIPTLEYIKEQAHTIEGNLISGRG